ncbi:MAG: DUF2807 domain-containing protein [Gammaproteobacteria bacterium]|nr:DUF2807 domain-containing protein [Gammaproteobacteria bacterium]
MKTSNRVFIFSTVSLFLIILIVSAFYRVNFNDRMFFSKNDYQKLIINKSSNEIMLPDFSSLRIYGNFNIMLNQNNQNTPSITGSKNELNKMIVSIKKNMIDINKNESGLGTYNYPIKATVTTNSLNSISVFGKSTIIATNLNTPQLTFSLNGNSNAYLQGEIKNTRLNLKGNSMVHLNLNDEESIILNVYGNNDIHLTGAVKNLTIKVTGNTAIDAKELIAENVTIIAVGNNKIFVSAADTLNMRLSGKNSILYYGKPRIDNESATPSSTVVSLGVE